jgi:hypothetical protein
LIAPKAFSCSPPHKKYKVFPLQTIERLRNVGKIGDEVTIEGGHSQETPNDISSEDYLYRQ